jgi:hypothetical protein
MTRNFTVISRRGFRSGGTRIYTVYKSIISVDSVFSVAKNKLFNSVAG